MIRLKQILINLVKNALKFTLCGMINILVAFDEEESLLIFKIMDTGKGFHQKDAPKLFQMFGKLKRTALMNNEGIGMGLMICHRLVHLNSGQISLTSQGENLGATAYFTFRTKLVDLQHDDESVNADADISY